MIKKLLFLLVICFIGSNLFGSHLVGGSLGYEYLGLFGGNYRYKIILTVYNNCDVNSNVPLPVATQPVAIYDHDVSATTPMLGNNKNYVTDLNLVLVDSQRVDPPATIGCPIGQAVCIYKATYEATVDLPLSFTGYHLYFTNFARNASITNLFDPGATAMSFHAYIPSTLVDNSSPVFSDDPVPFLCINDTVSILNTAIDPDGDQLVFSFVTPMADPGGPFPPTPLLWPITDVTYTGVYNVAQPFGPTGYSFINGATGLTEYMSPTLGNFVVAVEIKEIRNGNVIGITRRDLQLLVINCPPNPAPNLSATGGSGTTSYTIQECDTLTFPITFVDANGDSLELTTSGQIFDSSFVTPPAILDSLVIGDSTVTANFFWQTSCGTAQTLPYLFSVSVTDNGCPPKTTNVVYEVTVDPATPPDSIIGPPLVCQNTLVNYTTAPISGYTFNWTVTNGAIISGQGTNTVGVNWATVGAGTVTVNAISNCGCPSISIDTSITIIASPVASAGNDTNICAGDSVQIGGSPTGPIGTTFTWSPITNINDTALANPNVWPTSTTSYIVEVDNGVCQDLDTVVVSVGSATISVGNDTAICFGDSVQLNATGGGSYLWTPNTGLSDDTLSNPMATPTLTTVYTVTITDSLNCTGTDSIMVTVNPLPVITITPDSIICAGDCVQLLVTGGNSYVWTPSTGLSNDTIANPIACPTVTTNYIVNISDTNSCAGIDSVEISVNPLPVIITNNDTAVCTGNCVQLNTTGGISYVWSPSTGLSNDTIANPLACPLVTTTYVVTGTDANGCFSTDTVIIIVNALPTVDPGSDQGICVVGSVVIGGTPTGPVGATYLWSPSATINDDTLANPTATPIITTTYTVTVTDTNGCVDFDVITVAINPLPAIDAGRDTAICAGDTIVLGGTPTGSFNASFLWTPGVSLNDDTLLNPTATPLITTQYIVVVTDSNNCVNQDTVDVDVNPLPVIVTSNDTAICIGDCAQLTASGGTNYIWEPGASLSDSTIFNPIACPQVATTYMVTVTDGNNCSDTASVAITINPLPVIGAGSDVWVCSGDSIQLNATGGVSYLWTPSLGLNDTTIANPQAFPLDTTDYIVTGFDINGCFSTDTVRVIVDDEVPIEPGVDTTICSGDSIQLGGAPTSPTGTTYSWFPNATLDNDTLANPTAFPTVTTTYYVVATNDTCTAIDSITITVNQPPPAFAGLDVDICIGDSLQLSASGGVSYLWNQGQFLSDSTIFNPISFPTDTTEFIVLVTDGNNCTAFDSVIVNVNPLPTISAGAATSVCLGDSIQLNASGGVSYVWTPSSGLSNNTIANPMASPSETITYIVTGTDAQSCSNIDSVVVTINQLTVPDLTDTIICIGDAMQLTVNGPTGATYLWTPPTDLSNDTIFNPITVTPVTITYLVTITDTNGCVDTTSILVTAEAAPTADFSTETMPVCEGISADFTNLSIGAVTYNWNFGDGTQSTDVNPSHIFAYGTNSTVILTAYTAGICPDTASYTVVSGNFENYFNIVAPTVFSPNRDGINDLFKLDLPDEVSNCVNIEVFNRWGMKMYESYGQNSGWDGRTTAGKEVPPGTYFYIIEVNGITKKGSLTLLD